MKYDVGNKVYISGSGYEGEYEEAGFIGLEGIIAGYKGHRCLVDFGDDFSGHDGAGAIFTAGGGLSTQTGMWVAEGCLSLSEDYVPNK